MKTFLPTLAVLTVIGHTALAANMAVPAATAANPQVTWNLLSGSPYEDARNKEFGQPSLQTGEPKAGQPSASYHSAR